MASEIRLAFAHPAERSLATATDAPHDRISLRDHVREVEIGAFQAERGVAQRICFNVVVEVLPFSGPVDDDVDRILSYDRVTEAIATELAAERVNLLETLAERIAERILVEPQAIRAFVRIEKLDRGPGALGVEIVRGRRDLETSGGDRAQERPHPRVVFLSNAAIEDPLLPGWLDRLAEDDAPLILCVGAHDLAVPQTGHTMTQRRIDLLAIEQNGWRLAARDHRAKVVATRTELDWAMKNGQICVWAPAKMVLDATVGPKGRPRDALALSAWFAEQVAARELLVIGSDTVPRAALPVRTLAPGAPVI